MGNRMVQDRFQHSSETVHWHVATIVTLLAIVMVVNIIKPTDPTFHNVPSHIRNLERYWPYFKVLCEFGILILFNLSLWSYHVFHFTWYFVAMVRVALVRLIGFTSPWSYQLMSNTYTKEGKGSQQWIACAYVILTWNSHSRVLDGKS